RSDRDWSSDVCSSDLKRDSESGRAAATPSSWQPAAAKHSLARWALLAACIAVALAVGAAALRFFQAGSKTIDAVAVLPFANVGRSEERRVGKECRCVW